MQDYIINLQLFAGEKTEKATPHRKKEARKKGQVIKSNEVITVLLLTVTLLVIKSWLPYIMGDFQNFYNEVYTYTKTEITAVVALKLISETIIMMAKIVGPILLAALVTGFVANVLQIGFLVSTEPLKIDIGRLNPVKGIKRIFSQRAIAELFKTILKTCLVGFVAFYYLYQQVPQLSIIMDLPINLALVMISDITFSTCWRILIVLLIIAIADYSFQYYDYQKSLRMSKQEVKEEIKTVEGDPQLKAEIKARQRQMASRRMMQEVPEATVIITNPTHFAIAVKYQDAMSAPTVVAKGKDYIAQKIKELAIEHDIVIVENRELARTLYQEVEIGMPVPVELYKAVAEVLAYVYKLKGRF